MKLKIFTSIITLISLGMFITTKDNYYGILAILSYLSYISIKDKMYDRN